MVSNLRVSAQQSGMQVKGTWTSLVVNLSLGTAMILTSKVGLNRAGNDVGPGLASMVKPRAVFVLSTVLGPGQDQDGIEAGGPVVALPSLACVHATGS